MKIMKLNEAENSDAVRTIFELAKKYGRNNKEAERIAKQVENNPESYDEVYNKLVQRGENKKDDEEKAKQAEQQKSDKQAKLDAKNDTIALNFSDIEKDFNDPKFDSNIDYRTTTLKNLARNYSEDMGLKTAGEVLYAYNPKFIKSWANSFNWQAVADRNEPFVQALNNNNVKNILVPGGKKGNEERWVKLYNSLSFCLIIW